MSIDWSVYQLTAWTTSPHHLHPSPPPPHLQTPPTGPPPSLMLGLLYLIRQPQLKHLPSHLLHRHLVFGFSSCFRLLRTGQWAPGFGFALLHGLGIRVIVAFYNFNLNQKTQLTWYLNVSWLEMKPTDSRDDEFLCLSASWQPFLCFVVKGDGMDQIHMASIFLWHHGQTAPPWTSTLSWWRGLSTTMILGAMLSGA